MAANDKVRPNPNYGVSGNVVGIKIQAFRMRSLFLLAVFGLIVVAIFVSPYAGLLGWALFSFMHPQREVFGFASNFSFDWYFAVLTILAWLFSKSESKALPGGSTPLLMLMFGLWISVTTVFAVDPEYSFELWDRTIKTLLLVMFVMIMTTNWVRVHALVWMIVISLGYFAVKGAGFVVLGAGGKVYGPQDSMIGDNNHLSVALAVLLPLLLYLFRTSANRWARWTCVLIALSVVVTIVGTYSRGGFLALLAVGGFLALRSRAKVLTMFLGVIAIGAVFALAPPKWIERISTITAENVDGSVQGRFDAWGTAWNVAVARVTGGGFRFGEQKHVWDQYSGLPEGTQHRAAHNMYFQVLGEHGFIGLMLFLAIIVSALWDTQRVLRKSARMGASGKLPLELASALQIAILTVCVGTMSLSLAYFDGFFTLYAMTYSLRTLALSRLNQVEGEPASAVRSYARGR